MIVEYLHSLSPEERHDAFLRCCGSTRRVQGMCQAFPFSNDEELHQKALAEKSECEKRIAELERQLQEIKELQERQQLEFQQVFHKLEQAVSF